MKLTPNANFFDYKEAFDSPDRETFIDSTLIIVYPAMMFLNPD